MQEFVLFWKHHQFTILNDSRTSKRENDFIITDCKMIHAGEAMFVTCFEIILITCKS